jgi:phosphoribosylformylglycinamidine cyclo-ligase
MATDYKSAGVDIEAGYEAVKRIKQHAKSTYNERVLGDLGSFSGMFSIADMGMEAPVLVSGTDGVGTKLKLAFALDMHDTIGIDCVAMCVNDIICQGAKPLFFLDYIAVGKMNPIQVEKIVAGVAEGCRQANCALVGGETAEMPGFYPIGEYDVAGFAVGIVDRKDIIDGSKVKEGDCLVGLASSGVHSNGFSLVRKLVGETTEQLSTEVEGIGKIGQALLTPTKIYVKAILNIISKFEIHGAAHITGGGFIENLPRMYGSDLQADIKLGSWNKPKLFDYLCELGELTQEMAYNTFNMGIGMVLCVKEKDAKAVVDELNNMGEQAYIIGRLSKREVLSGVNFV